MRYISLLSLTAFSLLLMAAARAEQPSLSPCRSPNITLHVDVRNGLYDGMSQSGTRLVLHNTGAGACLLPQLPELHFSDEGHKPLIAERRMGQGLHPGPVLLPVTMAAAGAELQIVLRWVASDAFDGGNCIRPAFVSLELDGGALMVPFDRQMCAGKGLTGYYSQSLTGVPEPW